MDPKECCKTWSIPLPKCRDEMYNEAQSNPKCPTLKMTDKIQDIDKPNSFPMPLGAELTILGVVSTISKLRTRK